MPEDRLSVLGIWAGRVATLGAVAAGTPWRPLIEDLGAHAWEALRADEPRYRTLQVLLDRWQGGDRSDQDIADAAAAALFAAVELGAAVGYALAKTWPPELEQLDGWLQAALAYAGL